MHYIGLDVHKQSIAYCVKTADGTLVNRGTLEANRPALESWAAELPRPWQAAMEATQFSGWIHDTLAPYADDLAVAHPADLDRDFHFGHPDALTVAELARRCNGFPPSGPRQASFLLF